VRVVALVGDLLDRSKIAAAVSDAEFAATSDDAAGADVVVIDVKAHPDAVGAARKVAPNARIVAYGRHDNPAALEAARSGGADVALPRSRFFRDPAAAVTAALPTVAAEPEPETATDEDVGGDDST
jgi:DNA-binding NarL/FixJ family response regulator